MKKKRVKKLLNFSFLTLFVFGARSENRTRTVIRPRDFKSLASTSSAIRAWCAIVYTAGQNLSNHKCDKGAAVSGVYHKEKMKIVCYAKLIIRD